MNSHGEFSPEDTRLVSQHVLSIVGLQCGVLFLSGWLLPAKRWGRVVLAALFGAFATVNLYTLNLIHIEGFSGMGTVSKGAILAAVWLLFTGLGAQLRGFLARLISVLLLVFIVVTALPLVTGQGSGSAGGHVLNTFKRVQIPPITDKRNVYFFFFDALIPEAVARDLMGVDQLDYIAALRSRGANILRNTFVERTPTVPSVNALLALDLDVYDALPPEEQYKFDTGERPSPLYDIFKASGYKTQFLFGSNYFGKEELAGVDFYGTAAGGICLTMPSRMAFLGFCHPALGWARPTPLGEPSFQVILERIPVAANSNWLTVSYIFSPGHTDLDFNYDRGDELAKYRDNFVRNQKLAAEMITTLLDSVRANDPTGVVIVLGDHGAWMSRDSNPADPASPLSPKQIFQDQNGVAAAVIPGDFCAEEIRKAGEPLGITVLARVIISCLSGGVDPLPSSYRPDFALQQQYMYE